MAFDQKKYMTEYYAKNKNTMAMQHASYYAENKESTKATMRLYYDNNRESLLEKAKQLLK